MSKLNSILDLHAPLKKISKQKLKFRNKPWITLGLQKSISIKNHLLTKYIKLKDVTLKNEAQIKYKQYRNLLSTLMKESKKSYFTNYFQNNLNDLKSTWKGIKNLISLKELPNVAPSNIFDNGRSLTEPQEIANAFNKYFVNVATDIQSSIRYSKNNFHDFLHPININSFFLNPTDEIEVKNIILSLNPSRAIGPNSKLKFSSY